MPKVALAALSSALALVTAEAAMQVFLPIPQEGYGAWAAYPGSTLYSFSSPDGIRLIHSYNNLGFRGEDIARKSGPAKRIIAVGDSFTEGTGVAVQDAWPSALARQLNDPSSFEVLNLGDGGSGPDRYAQIIAKVAVALNPDHIIVCMIPSDLRNGPEFPRDLSFQTKLPDPFREGRLGWQRWAVRLFPGTTYLIERGTGRWPIQEGSVWPAFSDQTIESAASRIVQLEGISQKDARLVVKRRLAQIDSRLVEAARRKEFNPALIRLALSGEAWNYRVTSGDMNVDLVTLYEKTRAWLEWFSNSATEYDFSPSVLYFPQAALVVDRPWGVAEHAPEKAPVYRNTSVRDLLRGICEDLGVQFIDPTDALIQDGGEDLFLRYDSHPTARAHRLIAAEVAIHFDALAERSESRR